MVEDEIRKLKVAAEAAAIRKRKGPGIETSAFDLDGGLETLLAACAGGESNDRQTRRDYSRQTQLLAVRLSRNSPIHHMLAVGDE